MKKMYALLGSALLASAISLPASAASSDPTLILVDGEALQQTSGAPFSSGGTTFVPFRAIFQKLGMQVGWDAKTHKVTGKKAGLTIELTLGSKTARVNGAAQTMAAAPVSRNNSVFVPLRFISQAAGAEVNWEPGSGIIEIATAEAKEQDKADITALLQQMVKDYADENLGGYEGAFFDPTEFDFSDHSDFMKRSDFSDEITAMDLDYLDSYEASVYVTEQFKWTGGEYFADSEDTYIYTLFKDEGKWKVRAIELYDTYNTVPDLTKPAAVPADADQAVKAVLAKYLQAVNNKDWQGVLATFTAYEDDYRKNQDQLNYQDTFDAGFKFTLLKSQYLYNSSDMIVMYTEEKIEAGAESELTKGIYTFMKGNDGNWLIYSIVRPVDNLDGAAGYSSDYE
ncbi:copper amine oxidase N-terminal domain-containing protein [Paenibacillus pinistramenti]|uniref:copper amine oxidase N-terminal domain-containing protein n=1 Tax=Paenibacillus pinistramenti TaxID=1768003 RepID=UPI001108F61C|nr:copper amine oxidase N-terminal domain-containing protein [Paenibacillus pinistramenti]